MHSTNFVPVYGSLSCPIRLHNSEVVYKNNTFAAVAVTIDYALD